MTPQTPTDTPTERYFPYLDSARFLVIFGIMVVDLAHSTYVREWWLSIGVRSFFLLSGFFATMVILRIHDRYRDSPRWLSASLIRYYTFRVLRICPVYYAIVLAALVAGIPPMRSLYPLFLTFTQNFYPAVTGEGLSVFVSFWSLAALEQFYVLFPICFLFARRRVNSLLGLGVGAIVSAIFYRFVAEAFEIRSYHMLLPDQFDAFGFGMLAALVTLDPRFAHLRARLSVGTPFQQLAVSIALLVGVKSCAVEGWIPLPVNLRLVVEIFLVAIAIRALTEPQPRPLDRVLRQRWLCHLGVIAYGIYAYKAFSHGVLTRAFGRLGIPWPDHAVFQAALIIGFTIACALVSWHAFEKHILARRKQVSAFLLRRVGVTTR